MNKNVVLYASVHHHNTQRVAMQLAKDLRERIHRSASHPMKRSFWLRKCIMAICMKRCMIIS